VIDQRKSIVVEGQLFYQINNIQDHSGMTFWPMMAIRLPSDREIYNFSAPFLLLFWPFDHWNCFIAMILTKSTPLTKLTPFRSWESNSGTGPDQDREKIQTQGPDRTRTNKILIISNRFGPVGPRTRRSVDPWIRLYFQGPYFWNEFSVCEYYKIQFS